LVVVVAVFLWEFYSETWCETEIAGSGVIKDKQLLRKLVYAYSIVVLLVLRH